MKTSILELEDTDSESTMKDIEDNLDDGVPARRPPPRKPRKTTTRQRDEATTGGGPTTGGVDESGGGSTTAVSLLNPAGGGGTVAASSAVPNAMHFRFLTEMQQYEAVNATERMLLELEAIKRSAFDSQRSLAEIQAERRLAEQQRQEREREVVYDASLKQLLEKQVRFRTVQYSR